MSSVAEVKSATAHLSAQERWELYRWLGESEDVRQFRLGELRRDIAIGVQQADHGDLVPLDTEKTRTKLREFLRREGK